MINAILIDDESKARENLKLLLKEYAEDCTIIGEASSLSDGVAMVEELQPDLLFLDIQMQDSTGFDLLDKLGHREFDLIFVTAHNEFALQAFRYSAIDYLLKPIDIPQLEEALERVRRNKKESSTSEQIQMLLNSVRRPESLPNKIALPGLDSVHFVPIKDIVRCEAVDNYTRFFLVDGKEMLISRNIKTYEDLLEGRSFFRTHRSHLINLSFIEEYHRGEGGYVIMQNGAQVPVSRRKKTQFLQQFENL